MLILHAAFVERRFALWAETSLQAARIELQPRGRKRKAGDIPPPPPAGAWSDQLSSALNDAGLEPGAKRRLNAWLPTVDGRPAASSPLIGEPAFLPSFWSRKGTKRRWRIALGDEELSLSELKALARMKVPLVKLRGQWVQLTSAEIEEAIRFASKKSTRLSVGDSRISGRPRRSNSHLRNCAESGRGAPHSKALRAVVVASAGTSAGPSRWRRGDGTRRSRKSWRRRRA